MGDGLESRLAALRRRADEDFLDPGSGWEPGRHRLRIDELGVQVTLTRSRYPNRSGGVDMYAVTLSRIALDHPPGDADARAILEAAFGAAAAAAVERRGGPLVRMFRVPGG